MSELIDNMKRVSQLVTVVKSSYSKRFWIKIFMLLLLGTLVTACGTPGTNAPSQEVAKNEVKQFLGSKLDTDTTLLRRAGCYPLADLAARPAAEAAAIAAIAAATGSTFGVAVILAPYIGQIVAYIVYIAVYVPTQVSCLHTLNQLLGSVNSMTRSFENCVYRAALGIKDTAEGISPESKRVANNVNGLENASGSFLDVVQKIVETINSIINFLKVIDTLVDGIDTLVNCESQVNMQDDDIDKMIGNYTSGMGNLNNTGKMMKLMTMMEGVANSTMKNLMSSDETLIYEYDRYVANQTTEVYYVSNNGNIEDCSNFGDCWDGNGGRPLDKVKIIAFNDIREDLAGNYILVEDITITDQNFIPIGNFSHPFVGSFNGSGMTIAINNYIHPTNLGNIDALSVSNQQNQEMLMDDIMGTGIFGVTNYADIMNFSISHPICMSLDESIAVGSVVAISSLSSLSDISSTQNCLPLEGRRYGYSSNNPTNSFRSSNDNEDRPQCPMLDSVIDITTASDMNEHITLKGKNEGIYCLRENITLNAWLPRDISGKFYGGDNSIKVNTNLTNNPSRADLPVFHTIASGALVADIQIDDGGLAFINYGEITHVHSTGRGVNAFFSSLASSSCTYPQVTPSGIELTEINTHNFGGLVAYNNGTINYSSASGDVNALTLGSGRNNEYMAVCYKLSGNLSFHNRLPAYAGGIAGSNSINGIVNNSHVYDKDIKMNTRLGGLVGHNRGLIENSSVINSSFIGGYNSASVGGLASINFIGAHIENSSTDKIEICQLGAISGTFSTNIARIGGLVGANLRGAISRSSSTNAVGVFNTISSYISQNCHTDNYTDLPMTSNPKGIESN